MVPSAGLFKHPFSIQSSVSPASVCHTTLFRHPHFETFTIPENHVYLIAIIIIWKCIPGEPEA